MTTWPRQRSVSVVFVAAVMVAGSVAAPCAKAQEVEFEVDTTEVSALFVTVSLGARLAFGDVASPGVSGRLTVAMPGQGWFSMSFLAQMARWTVQYDPHTRRDYLFLRRFAMGVGTDEGPSAFVFVDGGTGRVETYPDSLRGKSFGLFGIGLGVGYTVGKVTATVDLSHGERVHPRRSYPYDLYTLLGVSLQWRVFRRRATPEEADAIG